MNDLGPGTVGLWFNANVELTKDSLPAKRLIYSEKEHLRENFSALKMGRGSPHCEILSGQILLEFKNNVSQCRKIWGCHDLWYIISIKDSENPKKPLYVRDNAENQCFDGCEL